MKPYTPTVAVAVGTDDLAATVPAMLRGGFDTAIPKAARIGYDAVELHFMSMDQIEESKVASLCRDNDIGVAALATGHTCASERLTFVDDDARVRRRAVARIRECIDHAAEWGASIIIGYVRGNVVGADRRRRELRERLREAIHELLVPAAEKRVPLVLEAINRYEITGFNSVAEVFEFVDEFDSEWVGVHADTFHMNIEDADPNLSFSDAAKRLLYVHFSDTNRRYPGRGHYDFRGASEVLRRIGYSRVVSIECLPEEDEERSAAEALEFTRRVLDLG